MVNKIAIENAIKSKLNFVREKMGGTLKRYCWKLIFEGRN
jgi:hypothetical protein